jgi:hypothetical protein
MSQLEGNNMSTVLIAISALVGILLASAVLASLFGLMISHGDRLHSEQATPDSCRSCALTPQERMETLCRAQRREVNGRVECHYRKERKS